MDGTGTTRWTAASARCRADRLAAEERLQEEERRRTIVARPHDSDRLAASAGDDYDLEECMAVNELLDAEAEVDCSSAVVSGPWSP